MEAMSTPNTYSDVAIAEARQWLGDVLRIPLCDRYSDASTIALADRYYPGGMAAIQTTVDAPPRNNPF